MRPVFAQLVGVGGHGAASHLDTQTVTVGASGTALNGDRLRGFITGSLGGISDGTSNLYGGAAIRQIVAAEDAPGTFDVILQITGVLSNSGWSVMTVKGTPLSRTDATFSTVGGNSTWTWPAAGNPLGTSGTASVSWD